MWTREQVADAMRRWYREEGRAPTADDWRTKARDWAPSHSTVTNLFGSWTAARKFAGLPEPPRRRPPPKRPRAEIAAELRRLAAELDGVRA